MNKWALSLYSLQSSIAEQASIAELASTAATDVGMHGLLASQSCYHSVLPPSLCTLWTSSRFLSRHPCILLIPLKIFFIYLFVSFFHYKYIYYIHVHHIIIKKFLP